MLHRLTERRHRTRGLRSHRGYRIRSFYAADHLIFTIRNLRPRPVRPILDIIFPPDAKRK